MNYEKVSDDALYLHAYWSRHTEVGFQDEFTVLPEVQGEGRYLGTTWAIVQNDVQKRWSWYVRPVQIDYDDRKNSSKPDAASIHVNTLDDYIGSGWWSSEENPEAFSFPYTGRSYVSTDAENRLSVVCYRYYIIDPLWFHRKIFMRIGPHLSKKIENRQSDWSTTAYFISINPQMICLSSRTSKSERLAFETSPAQTPFIFFYGVQLDCFGTLAGGLAVAASVGPGDHGEPVLLVSHSSFSTSKVWLCQD